MKNYNGNWLDLFTVSIVENDTERPAANGKILLETPHVDYLFTKEQWSEFKNKMNQV